ncbi:hypothetical protein C8R48DRAFT_38081 [Suillus tomentosus]|nr:hypothetical protein C8R48DRAFT_38081 [Suillus tomentosus]
MPGHAFRIGGATELLLQGVHPDVVSSQGRWTSRSFLEYWRRIETIFLVSQRTRSRALRASDTELPVFIDTEPKSVSANQHQPFPHKKPNPPTHYLSTRRFVSPLLEFSFTSRRYSLSTNISFLPRAKIDIVH